VRPYAVSDGSVRATVPNTCADPVKCSCGASVSAVALDDCNGGCCLSRQGDGHVPPVQEVMRAVRGGERTSPKTVLGFLAIMVSILASATVFSVLFLSEKSKLYYLIPIVLMVFIVVFVLITGAVLLIGWKDPSKLMLGQITGRDYALIQRLTLGDSNAGERVDNVIVEVGEISQLGQEKREISGVQPKKPRSPRSLEGETR
jgi:hypothetical protein